MGERVPFKTKIRLKSKNCFSLPLQSYGRQSSNFTNCLAHFSLTLSLTHLLLSHSPFHFVSKQLPADHSSMERKERKERRAARGQILDKTWELLRSIGRGSFAEVFHGEWVNKWVREWGSDMVIWWLLRVSASMSVAYSESLLLFSKKHIRWGACGDQSLSRAGLSSSGETYHICNACSYHFLWLTVSHPILFHIIWCCSCFFVFVCPVCWLVGWLLYKNIYTEGKRCIWSSEGSEKWEFS